jgi:hypothetical protein
MRLSIWAVAFALVGGMVGPFWDISWHQSIGRDTFWAWPHLPIYGFAALSGLAGAWAIALATLQKEARAISVGPFRGALGAFVVLWGSIAMAAAAPFDNWWHGAYGVDAVALSPPHSVLFIGAFAINLGALLLVVHARIDAGPSDRRWLEAMIVYVGGALLMNGFVPFWVELKPNLMHRTSFYLLVAILASAPLACIRQISNLRWACSLASLIYAGFVLLGVWILPLFPAQPKIGPVYHMIDHFVPPPFPILMIVPGFGLDVLHRFQPANEWTRHLLRGAVFVSLLLAAQWVMGPFLLSDSARNWFFGKELEGFWAHPESLWGRHFLAPADQPRQLASGLATAWVLASFGSGVGSAVGSWMRGIRR